eukprot:TRINITY_DN8735_c0_g1_i6.p3 TRINITY_DN8735_c0_g1~~TRINITY_DN8735_c0_g1_i6.p3  ORF type:complete len:130 (+),score=31.47 TRINITY_DN8735_c0_g1_i6:1406-1795(+)
MVEAELSPDWCLDSSNKPKNWKNDCQTAVVRREWEDFQQMGQTLLSGATDLSYRDACEIMGLSADVELTECEVSSAFRRLSRGVHPDKVGGGEEAAYQELNAARAVLTKTLKEMEKERARAALMRGARR